MEKLHPYDITDYKYLKQRGRDWSKLIMSLDEMEQIAVNLMNQSAANGVADCSYN